MLILATVKTVIKILLPWRRLGVIPFSVNCLPNMHKPGVKRHFIQITAKLKTHENNHSAKACSYICIKLFGAKAKWQWGRVGWILADHRDGLLSSSFLPWSSIAQSVCQRAFSLLEIWFQWPRIKSCIHQRKTTCLLSIWRSLACARASKSTTNTLNCFPVIGKMICWKISLRMLPMYAISHIYWFILYLNI